MRSLLLLSLLALTGVSSGCATIVHGSRQGIPINTTPEGATVFIDGREMGQTPAVFNLKRGEDHEVTVRLDGHREATLLLEKELAFGSAVVGNIFSWGIFGLAVDFVNGAAYRLEPEQLAATLEAQGMSLVPSADPDEIMIVLVSVEDVEAALAGQ